MEKRGILRIDSFEKEIKNSPENKYNIRELRNSYLQTFAKNYFVVVKETNRSLTVKWCLKLWGKHKHNINTFFFFAENEGQNISNLFYKNGCNMILKIFHVVTI